MDGRLVVTGGSIYDLLELLGRNLPNLSVPQIGALRHSLRAAFDRWRPHNSERLAKRNVHHHYDIDDRIYSYSLTPIASTPAHISTAKPKTSKTRSLPRNGISQLNCSFRTAQRCSISEAAGAAWPFISGTFATPTLRV